MRNVPLINVDVVPAGTQGIKVNVSDRVLSMKYEDREEKADRITLYIQNEDLRQFDEPLWRQGSTMIVSWGYADAMTVERLVRVSRISGFRQLAVEGVGGELAMDRIQQMRVFTNMTHSEIVRQIANEWGFIEDRVLHIQDTVDRHAITKQGKWTDAQFVRKLSKQNRFVWYIDFEGFHFHEQRIGEPPIKTYVYRGERNITEILDIALEVNTTRAPGSIKGVTYAPDLGAGIRFNAIHWDQTEKQIMAEQRENAGDYDQHIPGMEDSAHASTLRVNANSVEQVRNAANRALAAAQKEAVSLRMSVMGDPNIFAKSVIAIENIGKRLSQRYYVKEVVHSIGPGGYITELECLSDGSGGLTKSKFMPEATRIQMMENVGKAPKKYGEGKSEVGIQVSPEIRRQMIEHTIKGIEEAESRSISPAEAEMIVDRDLQAQAEAANQPAVIPAPEKLNPGAAGDTMSNAPPVIPLGVGNIDLTNRPYSDNQDGTYSTVRSMAYNNGGADGDGVTYLIPTTGDDGTLLTDEEAIVKFRRSGQQYGRFKNAEDATAYQQYLYEQQKKYPPMNTIGNTPTQSGQDVNAIMSPAPPPRR